jgi:hypothetical protein
MPNEIQHIVYTPWGGDYFELTVFGETATTINNDTATIEAALEAITGIGSGNVTVTETSGGLEWDVEFIGALANTNIPQMVPDANASVTTTIEGGPSGSGFWLLF